MKSKIIRARSYITIVAVSLCVSLTAFSKTVNSQQSESRGAPKYRIGDKYRPESNPSRLIIHISVDPKHFNRDDMIALARKLNKDFPREKQLTAAICDDYKTAKDPGIIYDLLRREPPPALRGFYDIDRVSGKEGIGFSTTRGKPLDEVSINFDGAQGVKSPMWSSN